MEETPPLCAAETVPPGPWAVGVSGGADSVALLSLLRRRRDLRPHVVHLDHETRGDASTGDARFVARLAAEWGLPCAVARWRDVEGDVPRVVSNLSARFRAGRRALFLKVVKSHSLRGVILAHHADDQAETVLLRLMERPGITGLGGMAARSVQEGMLVLRPLLRTRRETLRAWLMAEGQPWREDESNASDKYLRNRVRRLLAVRPGLTAALLELAGAGRELAEWVRRGAGAGDLPCLLPVRALADLPPLLAGETAKRWLAGRGVSRNELTPDVVDRLVLMALDAASPPRQTFPGGVLVRRRSGRLSVDSTDRGAPGDRAGAK